MSIPFIKLKAKIFASIAVVMVFSSAAFAIWDRTDGTCHGDEAGRFPWNYVCSWNGSDFSNDNGYVRRQNGSTPEPGSNTNPREIPAGTKLELEAGFDTYPSNIKKANVDGGGTSNISAHVFVTIDIRNEYVDANGGSIDPGSGSLAHPCPGTARSGGGNYSTMTAIAESPYAPANNAGDNVIDCGSEGKMILWKDVNKDDPGPFKFTINVGNYTPSSDDTFCVRANLSVAPNDMAVIGDLDDGDPNNDWQALKRLAKKTTRECYRIVPMTLKGVVSSVVGDATGKPLPDVRVGLDKNCDGIEDDASRTAYGAVPPDSAIKTGWARGEYKFRITKGERFCINAPTSLGIEGTDYNLINRQYQHGGRTDGIQYQNQVAGVDCADPPDPSSNFIHCRYGTNTQWDIDDHDDADSNGEIDHSYNFTYGPVAANLNPIYKSVNVGNGTNVKPGDTLNYTVEAFNTYDNNMPSVVVEDLVPYNIKDPTIDSVTLETNFCDPYRPGFSGSCASPPIWYAAPVSLSSCTGVPTNIVYGWVLSGNSYPSATVSCGLTNSGGRDMIYANFSRMPAYTKVTIKWHGQVKDADAVGVYPVDNSCSGAGDCQDKANGMQWVVNNARTNTGGVFGYNMTDADPASPGYQTVFNPIPGDMGIAKTVSTPANFGGEPAYSLDDPALNNATYSINLSPDTSKGPVEYQVIDQNNGAPDFNGSPLDIAIASVSPTPDDTGRALPTDPLPGATANSLGVLKWNGDRSSRAGARLNYSFNVTFDGDRPVGDVVTNVAKVCWTEFWTPGHPVTCRSSDTGLPGANVPVKRIRISKPTVAADYGGVNGGGNIRVTSTDPCRSDGPGIVRGNPGSVGMYMVTAENQDVLNSFGSRSGFTVNGTTPKQGVKCRPWLAASARTYSPSTTVGTGLSGAQNHTGRVVKGITDGSGNFVINNLDAQGRWTLYVEGRVFIRGNITTRSEPSFLADGNSFGIIATEGIYISKNVSRVDAMLYAGDYSTATNTYTPGIIDTCAESNLVRLGAGNSAADCRANNLTINGIISGRSLRLNRTKVDINVNADKVTVPGSAYLLTPPVFNLLFADGNSSHTREERPRF